jgi:DNA-binding MurR/RpiR family transcriptional regulator
MPQRESTLSRRQESLITSLLQHGTVARAAEASHVPISTAWRWLQQKDFADAYRDARRTITERASAVLQQASTEAAAGLIHMMRDDTLPPMLRFTIKRAVLELARTGEELSDVQGSIAALKERLSEPFTPAARKNLRSVK